MLSTSSRLRIQEILTRIASGKEVTLQERIHINKYASRDQNVSSWLKRAIRIQQRKKPGNALDSLIEDLDIGSSDPHSTYNPDQEDLGDWFSGAPSWLKRS